MDDLADLHVPLLQAEAGSVCVGVGGINPTAKDAARAISDPDGVQAAVDRCPDVSLLTNNAGAMLLSHFLAAPDTSSARTEMETSYFGTPTKSSSAAVSHDHPLGQRHAAGFDSVVVVGWLVVECEGFEGDGGGGEE